MRFLKPSFDDDSEYYKVFSSSNNIYRRYVEVGGKYYLRIPAQQQGISDIWEVDYKYVELAIKHQYTFDEMLESLDLKLW